MCSYCYDILPHCPHQNNGFKHSGLKYMNWKGIFQGSCNSTDSKAVWLGQTLIPCFRQLNEEHQCLNLLYYFPSIEHSPMYTHTHSLSPLSHTHTFTIHNTHIHTPLHTHTHRCTNTQIHTYFLTHVLSSDLCITHSHTPLDMRTYTYLLAQCIIPRVLATLNSLSCTEKWPIKYLLGNRIISFQKHL